MSRGNSEQRIIVDCDLNGYGYNQLNITIKALYLSEAFI